MNPKFTYIHVEICNIHSKDVKGKKRYSKKRIANAFFLFCKMERQKFQEQNPDLSSREVTKLLASRWQSLSENEKTFYKEKYKETLLDNENQNKKMENKMKNAKLTIRTGNCIYQIPGIVISLEEE